MIKKTYRYFRDNLILFKYSLIEILDLEPISCKKMSSFLVKYLLIKRRLSSFERSNKFDIAEELMKLYETKSHKIKPQTYYRRRKILSLIVIAVTLGSLLISAVKHKTNLSYDVIAISLLITTIAFGVFLYFITTEPISRHRKQKSYDFAHQNFRKFLENKPSQSNLLTHLLNESKVTDKINLNISTSEVATLLSVFIESKVIDPKDEHKVTYYLKHYFNIDFALEKKKKSSLYTTLFKYKITNNKKNQEVDIKFPIIELIRKLLSVVNEDQKKEIIKAISA